MKTSLVKSISIISICIFSIFFSLPSIVSKDKLGVFSKFLPEQKINLGLDLRGGSHLLLKINLKDYFRNKLESLNAEVKYEIRKNKINYKDIVVNDKEIIIIPIEVSSLAEIDRALRKKFPHLDIIVSQKKLYLSFNEAEAKLIKRQVAEQSMEIIRRRIDETGVKEPLIQSQGESFILLQLAGLNDPTYLKNMLGTTAKLSFHLLDEHSKISENAKNMIIPPGSKLVTSNSDSLSNRKFYIIKSKSLMTGESIEDARVFLDEYSRPQINFRLNNEGAKKFTEITRENIGKVLVIVMDNKVISDPVISQVISGGSGTITGNYSSASANELATLLRSGSLPASIEVVEERIVGPNLGTDSIKSGIKAGIIGFILVISFMFVTYGLLGLIADIALIFNILLILSLLSILGANLTLPGIAGIILTIGMAVDANILFFERIREELSQGKNLSISVKRGFDQAFSTVFDSNFTTIIAAILLYSFGSGTIKGFAVTLIIGIVSSMFTTISLTKLLIVNFIKFGKVQKINI